MLKSDKALSIGMLRSSAGFPDPGLPEWANTFARRMKEVGVKTPDIKKALEEMERARRSRVRAVLGDNVPITEFDEHLADMFNRFGIKL